MMSQLLLGWDDCSRGIGRDMKKKKKKKKKNKRETVKKVEETILK